jgi:hypothetical protein
MTTTDTDYTLLINRLQARHRALSGIKYAPDLHKYPTQLNTPSLPAVLTWIGGGSFWHKGGGWRWDDATALILLFVEPLGQNDIPTNASKAAEVLASLRALYITTAYIPLASSDDNASGYQLTIESSQDSPHTHGGIEPNLSFGGASYYGARLQVKVTMQWGAP